MKGFILLLFTAITGLTVQAQNYIPLIDSSARWLVRQGNGDTIPSYYYYGFNGEDTIINTITYKKLFRSDDEVFSSTEYFAAMREDVNTRKVFFCGLNITQEKQLYDFSALAGDTVEHGNTQCKIHHVDSILVGGVYRTNVHLNYFINDTMEWTLGSWVEGIGNISSGGLWNLTNLMITCDCNQTLVCYKKSGTWLYHNPLYSNVDCDVPVLNAEKLVNAKWVTAVVYPNPITGTSVLELKGSSSISRVDVYNMLGGKVRSYEGTSSKISISSGNLARGNYFYRLYDNTGNTLIGKFIVE